MNITKTMLVMTGFLALSLLVGCGEGEPPQTTADEPGKVAKSAAIELTDEQVKNIPWPTGATLVSIRRGSMVHIPHGTTYIETGDTLTFFGTGEAREELAYLVEPVGEATGEQPIISTDH